MDSKERMLLGIAESQFGLITREQALACGYFTCRSRPAGEAGKLIVVHPCVYRVAGVAPSLDQAYLAAVLYGGPGALLGGEPAGHRWGLDACRPVKPCILTTRNIRSNQICVMRKPDPVPSTDSAAVDSIPITSPTRTLIDLASLVSAARLHHAFDSAIRKRLTTPDRVLLRLDSLPRRGRRGIRQLLRMIDEALSKPIPHSWLERQFITLLRQSGFAEPIRRLAVEIGWERPIHIDFAYPDLLIGIETDGYEPHVSRAQWELDRRRDAALALLGWLILRFSRNDILNRPDYVLRTLRDALAMRRAIFS